MLFLARIMISVVFLLSALNKILTWQASERGLVTLFCDWHGYLTSFPGIQKMFTALLPYAPLILIFAIAVELIGSLLMMLGYKAKIGALMLFLYLIPVTFLLHQFWFLDGIKRELQFVLFMKNIAILGGLIFAVIYLPSIKKDSSSLMMGDSDFSDE
ncbi:MAG TPA: DoxX family protein [Chlamydiales bacterium]|nr:DoxX family protein [Chlamydiales bacterium]